MSLTNKILLGMLLGIVVGVIFNLILGVDEVNKIPTSPLGQWLQTFVINGVLDAIGQIFVASL
ncbi:MAG TPA: dicarboxylate/amino acid:cation symporter, partial [Cellvibrio sp.]